MVNQNISQTERDVDVKEVSDKCSYLITANAPWCSEQNYIGAIESGLYPLKPLQWNGRSNRRQAGEVLLCSTVVASVGAIVRLLLVMSGDVEENPGPLGEDPTLTHKNVLNALRDVVDWKSLGVQLDITAAKIREIDVNNRGQVADCRRDLVQFWLESDVSCSWRKLIDALNAIGKTVLAEEIRTTYQDSPLTSSNSSAEPKWMPYSEIRFRDIIFAEKDKIGDGGQGTVYKAFWTPQNVNVAVKVLQTISNAARKEIETLGAVKHTNIAQLCGVYENKEGKLCLVLELAETSLDKYLKQCTRNLDASLNWSMQIAEGMRYLHYGAPRAIVHGDLKSLNVLVYPGNVLKIADFGCAKFRDGKMSTVTRHTFQWSAPELFKGTKHSMESDVYAYGVVLWEIVTHEEPYKGLNIEQIIFKMFADERLEIPSDCHEVMKRIMLQCWDKDPKKRPTFKTVVHELESKAEHKDKDHMIEPRREEEMIGRHWAKMSQPSYVELSAQATPVVPTLEQLLHFTGKTRTFNVAALVGTAYAKMGVFLLKDDTGAVVQALELEHMRDAEKINMAIFSRWLQGKGAQPVAWSTLIDVLRKIDQGELADDIEGRLYQDLR